MPFFVADDGVRLHYQLSGNGRPVVLLHGLTANSLFFRKQIPVFSEEFLVIAPDLRGHGESEAGNDHFTMTRLAQDLKQLLAALNISRASFIGWSMGAHVIFEYIKQCGCEAIDRIVIIDMAPKLMKADDWNCGLNGIMSRKAGDFGHEDNLFLLSAMLNDWEVYSRIVAQRILNKSLYNEKQEFNAASDFMGKEDLPWLYEQTRKNKACVIAAFWITMVLQDYRSLLNTINVPCLLAYGTESNYYPSENYEYMRNRLPDARVIPFEECGHALHLQNPGLFNKAVMDFLRAGASDKER